MFQRPLIPVLLFFITGILVGRIGLPCSQHLIGPLLFVIVFLLVLSFLFPSKSGQYTFLFIFLLIGIMLVFNTKIHSDLLPLARDRERVVLEGTVLQPGNLSGKRMRIEVKADRLFVNDRIRPIGEKILLAIYNHPVDYEPGQRIHFPAVLRTFKNFNNPGGYNYERAMNLKGLSCAASVSDGRYIVPMAGGHLPPIQEIMEAIRRPIRTNLRNRLSPENYTLFRALILGERQGLGPDLREPFNVSGLGHILAVSGLHIGLIAWLSFNILRWLMSLSYWLTLRTNIRKIAAVITFFPVVIYTCLAGFQVSSQRAMIMVIAYLFSVLLGREKEVWSTLTFAALIVLALDPNALFTISFQLSFIAVTGILWLTPLIYNRMPNALVPHGQLKLATRLYLYILGLIFATFSALIFLLPITAFYFHRISVVSIPANLTTVPLLGIWILPLGLLSSFFLSISPSLANLFMDMGSWGLDWLMYIIRFWSHFDWSAFWVITPNIFEILLFYMAVFFLFSLRRGQWAKIGLSIVLIAGIVDTSYWIYETRFNKNLRITYLDVGQGNSALIQFPGKERLLLDGGGFGGSSFDMGRMVIAPFLFHSKILHVDYLALSHPQSDHMDGLRFIASNFQPGEFWYNGQQSEIQSFNELMNIVESKKITIHLPADLSKTRNIAGVKIELLHPPAGKEYTGQPVDSVDMNNNSMVLKFSYEGKAFLFPGDIEISGEATAISNAGSSLQSDVLLAPHHGSKSSCSAPFLRMVKPEVCVISSGSGNRFGFPHRETLKRLKAVDCRIIRIDKVGAIQISSKNNQLKINSFLGGDHP